MRPPGRQVEKRKSTSSPSGSSDKVEKRKKRVLKGTQDKNVGASNSQVSNSKVVKNNDNQDSEDDDSEMESISSFVTVQNKTRKIKPIIVDASYQVLKNHLVCLKFTEAPTMQIKGPKKTHIICSTLEDKQIITKSLAEKLFVFHSFAEPNEKKKVFVLKGFYYDLSLNQEQNLSAIYKILKDSGVECQKITFLSKNVDYPIYLVHFNNQDINVLTLKQKHRAIDGLLVKWETISNSKKRPTQCFRCQLYGHSASNCNRPYRCVKCTNEHEPGKCSRQTREGTASCINCKGDHSANSSVCPNFISYSQMIKRQQTNSIPARRNQSQTRQNNHQHSAQERLKRAATLPDINNVQKFPYLSQNQNVNRVESQVSESSASNSPSIENELHSLTRRFNNIPNIHKTLELFRELIEDLEKTRVDDHASRVNLLMKFPSKSLCVEKNDHQPQLSNSNIESMDDSTDVSK